MTSDLFTVTLEKLTYGGEAMGRLPDGRAVFVPFALPGEQVCVRLVEEKRGHARAELMEVRVPSPERIAPRCKHFGACGGCHYQHMPYAVQLRAKESILCDQLQRIGCIESPPLRPIVPSPQEWHYRNHVQFHLSDEGKLGFVAAGNVATVIPISECHLPEAPLNDLWPQLAFDPGLNLDRVSLRLGVEGEMMLVLESPSPEPPELEIEADASVVHLYGEDAVVLAGEDSLAIAVKACQGLPSREFRVSAASFFQVNTPMAAEMANCLLTILPVSPITILLDVYCGVGLFGAFFAPRVGRVIGIESSSSACGDFVVNLDEFDNVELYEAPAEDVLPALDVRPDIVIVDPPRAGLDRRVVDGILALSPKTLAYVSCDPSTLARDAARLIAGGYRLVQVTPFDLFPQTYHIESVSLFEKV